MAEQAQPGVVAPGRGSSEPAKLPLIRRAMARRMAEAATVPCFYLRITADAGPALAARRELADADPRPTLNDYIVRAVARALAEHPAVNASFDEGGIVTHARVNVGVAISIGDGLVVPAVYDADRKSAVEIAAETRALVVAAGERSLGRDVLRDSTFTVSNLGMFAIEDFDPVVNPPQAAILGVGAAAEADGSRPLRLTLGCDHRVLTGTEGALFLASVKEHLEAAGATR